MSFTRLQIQQRLQYQLQNPTYYQTYDFNNSIQDGTDEICAYTGCIYNSASIPFTQNTTYYDLPSILPDYIGVVAIFNSVINRWMWPQSIKKFWQSRIDWSAVGGTPYYFAPVSYRYVAIYYKPLVTNYGNMFIYYRAAAPELTDSTNIPIPDDHITALESYCTQDLWEQNQEWQKAGNYQKSYVEQLDKLRVYMRNKRFSGRYLSLR